MAVLSTGTILIVGGRVPGGPTLNDVWWSTNDGQTWAPSTHVGRETFPSRYYPLVVVVHTSAAAPVGDAVLILGGHDGTTELNDCWIIAQGGVTISEVSPGADWSPRIGHAAAVLSDGVVVIMGGAASSATRNDVWKSADVGATWTLVTGAADWAPRQGPAAVALADDSIVLAGGADGDGQALADVWISSNSGATWNVQTEAAPWSARDFPALVPQPNNGVAIIGAFGGGSIVDVWRSADAGVSWDRAAATGSWSGRTLFKFGVLPDGRMLIIGGKLPKLDVWTAARPASWADEHCSLHFPGICGAAPHSAQVSVSLPSSAAGVSPLNAASNSLTLWLHKPRPSLELVSDGRVHSGAVDVAVTFDGPVTGLTPSAFSITAASATLTLAEASVIGAGLSWMLTVTPHITDTAPCASGYTAGVQGSACLRVVEEFRSWQSQNAACAPYALASIASEDHNSFALSMLGQQVANYWCGTAVASVARAHRLVLTYC